MNQEITNYIAKLPEWQQEICNTLHTTITGIIPGAEERLQYGKPHYLKDGQYAAVIQASKEKVTFTIFNAGTLDEISGFFAATTTPDRKTATIKAGQATDYQLLGILLKKAVATIKK